MTDPPPYGDSDDRIGVEPNRGSTTATPRWVKVFGIIAVVFVVLVVVLLVFGRGSHGPGRHAGSGSNTTSATPGGDTGPPFGVARGEQQP